MIKDINIPLPRNWHNRLNYQKWVKKNSLHSEKLIYLIIVADKFPECKLFIILYIIKDFVKEQHYDPIRHFKPS